MRSRYRSLQGQHEIRGWCLDRLDDWNVDHERVDVGTSAGQTHVVLAGAGDATVIYLPGTNFNAATSRAVAGELAQVARVVVPDLPGQPGLSDEHRPAGEALAGYGAWLGEIIDAFGAADAPLVLVGHSLGAAVALAAEPHGVDGLMLVSPAGLVRLRVPAPVLRTTLTWLARPKDSRSRQLLKHLSAANSSLDSRLVDWMTLVSRNTMPVGAPGPLPVSTLERWLGTPRMVVTGRQDCFLPLDRIVPAAKAALLADVEVLCDAGHLSVEEQPGQVRSLVTQFISDLPTQSREM